MSYSSFPFVTDTDLDGAPDPDYRVCGDCGDDVPFGNECPRCECCRHCGGPLSADELKNRLPALNECESCIEAIRDEWTSSTLEQLCAQVSAMRRFGYLDFQSPLREVLAQVRRAA